MQSKAAFSSVSSYILFIELIINWKSINKLGKYSKINILLLPFLKIYNNHGNRS